MVPYALYPCKGKSYGYAIGMPFEGEDIRVNMIKSGHANHWDQLEANHQSETDRGFPKCWSEKG